ncbi:hypothetical protein ILYODFUR_004811 [Ilyodon furcidens]|uniref:Uncharacterized protein n=1 Tax=Ilyodon furcidens TaxID=33524 RepID=A0ABV0SII6_9TELE
MSYDCFPIQLQRDLGFSHVFTLCHCKQLIHPPLRLPISLLVFTCTMPDIHWCGCLEALERDRCSSSGSSAGQYKRRLDAHSFPERCLCGGVSPDPT